MLKSNWQTWLLCTALVLAGLSLLRQPQPPFDGNFFNVLASNSPTWTEPSRHTGLYSGYQRAGQLLSYMGQDSAAQSARLVLLLLGLLASFYSLFRAKKDFFAALAGAFTYLILSNQTTSVNPALFSFVFLPLAFSLLGSSGSCSISLPSFSRVQAILFPLLAIVWLQLDFGFVLFIVFLFLSGLVLLKGRDCAQTAGYPGFAAAGLLLMLLSSHGRTAWQALISLFQDSSLSVSGVYQLATANFHLEQAVPLAFLLLLAASFCVDGKFSIRHRVGVFIAFIGSLLFRGFEFILAFQVAALVAEALNSRPLLVGRALAASSLVLVAALVIIRPVYFSKGGLPQEPVFLEALNEISQSEARVLNHWTLGYGLSELGVPPFIDARRGSFASAAAKSVTGSLYLDYQELFGVGERWEEVLDFYSPKYAVLYKGSSLASFLIYHRAWLKLGESSDRYVDSLGRKVNSGLIILRE